MDKNTPEYISWLLNNNDRAVERAMLVLFHRQTNDEQACGDTRHRNGRGFSAGDAKKGTYMAKWVQSGKHLTGPWLERARTMSKKYVGQLVEEATLKLEREAIQFEQDRTELARVYRGTFDQTGDEA